MVERGHVAPGRGQAPTRGTPVRPRGSAPAAREGAAPGGGAARDGLRKLPFAYGAYLLVAVKRVHVVTPLRKLWRNPAKVAAPGLVEPSTRNRL